MNGLPLRVARWRAAADAGLTIAPDVTADPDVTAGAGGGTGVRHRGRAAPAR